MPRGRGRRPAPNRRRQPRQAQAGPVNPEAPREARPRTRAAQQQGTGRDTPPVDGRPDGSQKRGADEAELDEFDNDPALQSNADVWVLGDSIPFWAGVHANSTGKANLRIDDVDIGWFAVSGLGWRDFRHYAETHVLFDKPPGVIIIHVGGNDLTKLTTPAIRGLIETEVRYLRDAFPDSVMVWVDILQRCSWAGSREGYIPMERKRKRLNRFGRKIVLQSGKADVLSPDIDNKTAFFRPDGIHLNDVGLEFYLDYVRDIIIKYKADFKK